MAFTADFPDFTKGVAVFKGGSAVLAGVDFPDWTDGVVQLSGTIIPGQDFPDWTKAQAAVPGVFTGPASISGLFAWYDAAQITGQADGSALATWPDATGNGNNVSTSQTTKPIYYKTTAAKLVNGLPAVWFTTAGSPLRSAAANFRSTADGSFTCFAVAYHTDTGATVGPGNAEDNIGHAEGLYYNSTTLTANASDNMGIDYTATAGTVSTTAADCLAVICTATTVTAQLNGANGTPVNLANVPHSGGQTFGLGGYTDGAGSSMQAGPVCEIMWWNRALTTLEQGQIRSYCQAKWGTP